MIVYNITTNTPSLAVTPLGNRLYKTIFHTLVTVETDEGNLVFKFMPGFVTNFRSGGRLVDGFVDQIGDEKKALCYLVHDAMYTPCSRLNGEHPVSRALADDVLRAGLVWAGMSKIKAAIVYSSVRVFGSSAFEDDDELTESNSSRFSFEWEGG